MDKNVAVILSAAAFLIGIAAAVDKTAETSAAEWEQAFKFVRDAIQTEPSRFSLKTTEGVRWGRRGNSLEKALLLAEMLQEKGMTVQIVEGELGAGDAEKLVASLFPTGKTFSSRKDVPVSTPAEDPRFLAAVKRHFWVRAQSGDDWLDLDPSFPGAKPGKAVARETSIFDPSDEALKTRVSITLEYVEGKAGEPQPALSWQGLMEEAANKPLSLTVTAEFEKAAAEEEEEEGAGGLFGALAGKEDKKKKGQAAESVFYNAALEINGEGIADGAFRAEKEPLTRLALRIKFESLEEIVSESERILFEAAGKDPEPPLFQRHAILLTGNMIPSEAWQGRLEAVSDKNLLADVKAQVEEVKKSLKAKKFDRGTLEQSAALEQKVGPELGHLLNLIFASTSDGQTAKEGEALSVASYYEVPRVIICSFAGDEKTSEVSFDLRQDRIEAVALTGQVGNMKQAFLYGRGVMESILEGKLLELLAGKRTFTTAVLMQEASQKNIPLRTFSSLEKDRLAKLGLPEGVGKKVLSVLDSGRLVVIPEKAVVWQGKNRWGWWDVDPGTLETIGVMDTGLHQAVLERTILDSKGPLESKMGMVIGAMVGAIDTYWLLSAMVLKYGELNKAALLEAKAYMKEIDALMCPGFEKKVEASVSLTVVDIEDCFKYELELAKADAGIEIKQGWCENFAKGFACASTSILNYYLSQTEE